MALRREALEEELAGADQHLDERLLRLWERMRMRISYKNVLR